MENKLVYLEDLKKSGLFHPSKFMILHSSKVQGYMSVKYDYSWAIENYPLQFARGGSFRGYAFIEHHDSGSGNSYHWKTYYPIKEEDVKSFLDKQIPVAL